MLDCNCIGRYTCRPWLASGMKICGGPEIRVMGGLGVFPDTEEMDLAADLLAPLAVVMGGQRERRIRL